MNKKNKVLMSRISPAFNFLLSLRLCGGNFPYGIQPAVGRHSGSGQRRQVLSAMLSGTLPDSDLSAVLYSALGPESQEGRRVWQIPRTTLFALWKEHI